MKNRINKKSFDDKFSLHNIFTVISSLKGDLNDSIKKIVSKISQPDDMYVKELGGKLFFEEINDLFHWFIITVGIDNKRKESKNSVSKIINLEEHKIKSYVRGSLTKEGILKAAITLKGVESGKIDFIVESGKIDFINVFDPELINKLNSLDDAYFERIIKLADNNSLLRLLQQIELNDNSDDINWREFPNIG